MSTAQADRLATLKSEQDFLLVSLRDLDAEMAAGDIDPKDYQELKDSYIVRSAEVIREIESVSKGAAVEAGGPERPSIWGRLWVMVGLVLFVLVAGYVLAQAAGERGVNDELSGGINRTPRERVLECQSLGPDKVTESLECYQEVLDVDPNNVEAHTYRGWALILVIGSAQQSGNTEIVDVLLPQAMIHLDRAVEIDPEYPDVRAFRAVVFEAEGELENACVELAVLDSVDPPAFIGELTAPLRERLGC